MAGMARARNNRQMIIFFSMNSPSWFGICFKNCGLASRIFNLSGHNKQIRFSLAKFNAASGLSYCRLWTKLTKLILRKIFVNPGGWFIKLCQKPSPFMERMNGSQGFHFKKLDIHSNPVNLIPGGRACRVSLWRYSETWGNRRLVPAVKFPTGKKYAKTRQNYPSRQSQWSRNPPG